MFSCEFCENSKNNFFTEHTQATASLVAIESGIEHDDYLQQLFRVGTLSIAWRDFIFQTFSMVKHELPVTSYELQVAS